MSEQHDFDDATDFCRHCGVPKYAVTDGMAAPICGSAPPPPSLNHGGPGICRMCYPNGAPKQLRPLQQGELLL